ncbi:hypothetical protein NM688_g4241 [Phlebia brevispora]|uniref:Uncharacterized protein n=1 Tax=Phlebia brevispora TaxID=194682 RepID=A0ACC1T3I0_9APHY|nr:hypothetical protein NM688_g4241 [Phlebia brevispora]
MLSSKAVDLYLSAAEYQKNWRTILIGELAVTTRSSEDLVHSRVNRINPTKLLSDPMKDQDSRAWTDVDTSLPYLMRRMELQDGRISEGCMDEVQFLDELTAFLISPECQELLAVHPNQTTAVHFRCPDSWLSWWMWAGENPDLSSGKWLLLWRYYVSPQDEKQDYAQIPGPLRRFIDTTRRLQLIREPGQEVLRPSSASEQHSHTPVSFPLPGEAQPAKSYTKMHGMSPKKAHEVQCMTTYTSDLLSSLSRRGTRIQHVVDIGAGQAYVTRALRDKLGLEVLAVDWSPVQAEGAARREEARFEPTKRESVKGSLTYQTLTINKDSLLHVTDEWAAHITSALSEETIKPLPVLLLALHACGSLTIDVLRAFCERVKSSETMKWRPVAALIVGCCYNLLKAEDCTSLTGRNVPLTPNHLQLAAQVPRHWDRTPAAFDEAKLAIRKVAWRALLEGILSHDVQTRVHPDTSGARRLGRLNNSTYKSWETFLSVAEKKLERKLTDVSLDMAMTSRLEVFQLLRCILGPVIESFLLLDRKVWLRQELQGTKCSVGLLNLFDQRRDSARNVAIVISS